jgi:hypothetical protein
MFNTAKRNAPNKGSRGKSRKDCRKRLRLESLESRRLLAGDVGVDVVDGNLLIRGDRLSNAIEIRQAQDGSGDFVIRGLETEDGVATTVNGEESARVDGVTGDVLAALQAGDDVIYIHDADLPRNLVVRTGSGADTVLVGGLPRGDAPVPEPLPPEQIDAALTGGDVDGVPGEPTPVDPVPILPIPNVTIAGSARVTTSGGQDRIGMGSVDVGRNLVINTGRHDDFLTLGLNELPGPIDDAAVRVVDEIPGISLPLHVRGSMRLNTGRGADSAWLESVHVNHNLRANLGLGDDVFAFDWGAVAGHVEVHGTRGNDIIALAHLKAEQIAIRAGRGDDGVGLAEVKAGRIGVGMGSGNDQMRVANTAARVARFHGGGGTDSLEFQGENELHDLAIINFEVIS